MNTRSCVIAVGRSVFAAHVIRDEVRPSGVASERANR